MKLRLLFEGVIEDGGDTCGGIISTSVVCVLNSVD